MCFVRYILSLSRNHVRRQRVSIAISAQGSGGVGATSGLVHRLIHHYIPGVNIGLFGNMVVVSHTIVEALI